MQCTVPKIIVEENIILLEMVVPNFGLIPLLTIRELHLIRTLAHDLYLKLIVTDRTHTLTNIEKFRTGENIL